MVNRRSPAAWTSSRDPGCIICWVAIGGYTDLFAAGLGFDITGAYLLAQGSALSQTSTRDGSWQPGTRLARQPSGRQKTSLMARRGCWLFVLGLGIQAAGYALSIGGVRSLTH